MSFMFNPYPYDDPNAYNPIDSKGIDTKSIVNGNAKVAAALADLAEKGLAKRKTIVFGFDGYSTAPIEEVTILLSQELNMRGIKCSVMDVADIYMDEAVLDKMIEDECLPMDREQDPVLLYGKRFEGTHEDLFDQKKLAGFMKKIRSFRRSGEGVVLAYGYGALCKTLRALYDKNIYVDQTPLHTVLNVKAGKYKNIGRKSALAFKATCRRCYYVDYELALELRHQLMKNKEMDYYIIGVDATNLKMMPFKTMMQIFDKGLKYPFRTKPVYLEGVWGGYSVMTRRNLPKEMKNCAWVFDMIPMEVSLVYEIEGVRYEFPFYTLVQSKPLALMGKQSVDTFGDYFPIRFNYDDTMHASGNMSIQCHPDEDYVVKNNGELGRQDESYYIVEAGNGARTYLGFNNGIKVDDFVKAAKKSEKDATPIDYQKYVYSVESKPGTQVTIPAGTIHASGRNQLILEIGSLTVGSYTYKMYDYLRKDLDGKPRPIHTYHGDKVLKRDHNADWVEKVAHTEPKHIRGGEDWEEYFVADNKLLYFNLRNVKFQSSYEDNTDGLFHVLSLVDGEQVKIVSKKDPSKFFIANYLDIVCVPADMGEYEVINLYKDTTAIIHKTQLRKK